MTDEQFLELLRKALESRKRKAALPPKLEPELGKEYVLRLVSKQPSPWRQGRHVFIVYDFETEEEWRLPSSVVLEQELAEAKPGDYLLIRMTETRQLKDGRRMRNFEIAILPSEEAVKLQSIIARSPPSQPELGTVQPPSQPPSPSPPLPPSPSSAEPQQKKEIAQHALDEIKMLVDTLLEVYGSVTLEDLDLYLNTHKKLNVDVKSVVEGLGYIVEGNRVRKP